VSAICSNAGGTWRQDYNRTDVKHGRFTEEEKAILKTALKAYAENNNLDSQSYDWLYEVQGVGKRGALTEIAAALPSRNRKAVWACLTRMVDPGNYKVR
jgi:hypothetical protein